MTENPYEAPEAPIELESRAYAAEGSGTFTLGQCLSDGWQMTISNFWLVLGVGIVGYLLMGMAAVTIIGMFVIVPVLGWGIVRFGLNLHDGKAEFGDLFEGFQRYGERLGPMLGLGALLLLIGLLSGSIQLIGIFTENSTLELVGSLFSMVFSLVVTVRLYFAPMFIVDQELGAMAAMGASWEVSKGLWLNLVALALVSSVVALAGVLALFVGMLITVPMSYLMFVSAYRQVVGRPSS